MLPKSPSEVHRRAAKSHARDLAWSLQELNASRDTGPDFDWCLGTGELGVVLAQEWMDRAFPSEGWDLSAKRRLDASVRCIAANSSGNLPRGLYGGVAGAAFVTSKMSRGSSRYRTLNERLSSYFSCSLRNERPLLDGVKHIRAEDYDLISGLAGLMVGLDAVSYRDGKNGILTEIVTSLVTRISKCGVEGSFFLAPTLSRSESLQLLFPGGYVDCGFAHGVPGTLTALARHCVRTCSRGEIEAAINAISDWLLYLSNPRPARASMAMRDRYEWK